MELRNTYPTTITFKGTFARGTSMLKMYNKGKTLGCKEDICRIIEFLIIETPAKAAVEVLRKYSMSTSIRPEACRPTRSKDAMLRERKDEFPNFALELP